MSESGVLHELDKRWKSTCRMLLNEEVGGLADYEGWLASQGQRTSFRKSRDGKTVAFYLPYYAPDASIISYENADFNRKFEPLSINDVKDLDSIIGAVSERISYAGNVVLGTSQHVEQSTDVVDSFYVKNSAQVWDCKYIHSGFSMEHGECLFGSTYCGHFKFCIASHSGDYLSRCLMTDNSYESSDCHYCFGLAGAKNCMFSFNLQGASYRIGNLQLPPDKYNPLKAKLLSEIAEALRKEKKLPSLFELAGSQVPDHSAINELKKAKKVEVSNFGSDTSEVEREFRQVAKLVLGKEFGPMSKYSNWLGRFSTLKTREVKSPFDNEKLTLPDYCSNFDFPEGRVMRREHALALSSMSAMDKGSLDGISLRSIPKAVSKIAYFDQEYFAGKALNLVDTQITINAVNSLRSTIIVDSKNCGYDYYIGDSNSVFGCNSVRKSSYALKCYLSTLLTRCFEVDSSKNCSDSYFLHNCENVHDSMFCFNTKNKRNAIGNAELPKDKYIGIKAGIVASLAEKLEKDKDIGLSIFSLGKP